ncbi:amidohydrolase, partial [Candidatus Magnetomorum sp. HK-1]
MNTMFTRNADIRPYIQIKPHKQLQFNFMKKEFLMNTFDIIIQNANVYDGTGSSSYVADIAIQDGRIAAISKKINASAEKIIDASNKAVCPGFIDVHSHADLTIHLSDHHKILEPLLRQGVTTFVGGNCGMGPAPIDDYHRQEAITYVESMMGESVQSSFHWSSVGSFLETLDKQG